MPSPSPRQETVSLSFDKAPQLAALQSSARPRNHVRSISIEPRIHAQSVFDRRARDRAGFLSPQEKMELELEREAVLQIQNAQAAKRRPKIMRLTPAFPNSRKADAGAKSPSPPSSAASSIVTASEEELATPPGAKIPFPVAKAPTSGGLAMPSTAPPLHPASRKALALKANSPGPEVSGLHIDIACIPTPSVLDQHAAASTSTLPELIRKKSGEPVKSSLKQYPSSALFNSRASSDASIPSATFARAKSVPSTPNVPKAVHFDSQLEHIKIFRVKGRPTAVSREGSPEQTETETEEEREYPFFGQRRGLPNRQGSGAKTPSPTATPPVEMEEQLLLRLPNFPSSARLSVDRDIFLERVYLSDDLRSVKGTVQVRNLSFEKWVAVRFTLDHWATVSEVSAEYSESIKDGDADRFVFSIKLNELLNWPRGAGLQDTKTMFVCLRYTVNGREIWDNNDGANYQLDFRKRQLPAQVASYPPAGEVAKTASANGGTLPRRYTTGATAPPTSRIIEMGRRSGVHGQRTKGDTVMEQLRRELDRLRSDEEDHDGAVPTSGSFIQEVTKRRSPPVSPGGSNQRAASPSVWTARYDFGASLRNPKSGSRTTDAGRAAALDYFSSRPPPSATSPIRSTFVVSAASPTGSNSGSNPGSSGSTPRITPNPSPNFQHKFGMLSPGLDHGVVQHQPASTYANTSPSGNTLTVPEPVSSSSSHRFYSFPPNRSTYSPGGSWAPDAKNDDGPGDRSPSPRHLGSVMVKPDGLVLEDYTPDGSQASPTSLTGSPNPFSPAMSVSSIESDTTVGMVSSDDARKSLADSLDRLSQMPSSRFLRDDALTPGPRPSSFAAGDTPESHGYSPSLPSSTHSPSSEIMTPDDLIRPTSMASFNELVARFCWNSDNQLPTASSDLHALGSPSSPTDASGRSTPTAVAGPLM
ncbi:uncharacterized protein PFL1_00580 [Pseudozyma flocculosa PF-1]|uniref:CBM21 domain-containing protein n=1 Tax=Pseudozyma flocculosa TaxID=84751 RepID=A0A5C3ERD0_9BASI|nr:uncharacterized protein PFL1_00580 [Pseudozyma flocculosa PF-1]EPQ32384.1 hypothetical protein PFL1_00580 [Pseudozyma flocculosa PF-1]SPO34642.1 uncharacterized protein PSFLO_00113 [Pseudozyma flocculosa]